MGQLKTERIKKQELDFTYNIYVNKEGQFSTTLSPDVVKLFEDAGIELHQNRMKNSGYFVSNTYEGLKDSIENVINEYYSKELLESKIVIRYIIQTTCLYCLDIDSNIVPNGEKYWTKTDSYSWKEGTIEQHEQRPQSFGFNVYAKPYRKETSKFKSGRIETKYEFLHHETERGTYLDWLNSFVSMTAPRGENIKEIDYTEEAAAFFVELLTSICQLNEKIKDFLTPDKLIKVIENKQKLLA